jgi:hypothetical protein
LAPLSKGGRPSKEPLIAEERFVDHPGLPEGISFNLSSNAQALAQLADEEREAEGQSL